MKCSTHVGCMEQHQLTESERGYTMGKHNKGEWVKVDGQEVRVIEPGEYVVHVQGEDDRYPKPVRADQVEDWQRKTD